MRNKKYAKILHFISCKEPRHSDTLRDFYAIKYKTP